MIPPSGTRLVSYASSHSKSVVLGFRELSPGLTFMPSASQLVGTGKVNEKNYVVSRIGFGSTRSAYTFSPPKIFGK